MVGAYLDHALLGLAGAAGRVRVLDTQHEGAAALTSLSCTHHAGQIEG